MLLLYPGTDETYGLIIVSAQTFVESQANCVPVNKFVYPLPVDVRLFYLQCIFETLSMFP
jgi:hypothetical protein